MQLYTGFVYEGPALVSRINKALARGSCARERVDFRATSFLGCR
ncbi:hypothetical protein [Hymenobacter terrigena]